MYIFAFARYGFVFKINLGETDYLFERLGVSILLWNDGGRLTFLLGSL